MNKISRLAVGDTIDLFVLDSTRKYPNLFSTAFSKNLDTDLFKLITDAYRLGCKTGIKATLESLVSHSFLNDDMADQISFEFEESSLEE